MQYGKRAQPLNSDCALLLSAAKQRNYKEIYEREIFWKCVLVDGHSGFLREYWYIFVDTVKVWKTFSLTMEHIDTLGMKEVCYQVIRSACMGALALQLTSNFVCHGYRQA